MNNSSKLCLSLVGVNESLSFWTLGKQSRKTSQRDETLFELYTSIDNTSRNKWSMRVLAQVKWKYKCSPREWWWENGAIVTMSSVLLSYFRKQGKIYKMIYVHFPERIYLILNLWQLSQKALWFILGPTKKLYLAGISGFYPT